MQKSKSEVGTNCMMILIGIILIITGIIYINVNKVFMETAVKTQATVIDIIKHTGEYTTWEGEECTETSYTVIVEFYIKNKKINSKIYLDDINRKIKKNEKIDIYYNPADTGDVKLAKVDKDGEIIFALGILFVLGGVIYLAKDS